MNCKFFYCKDGMAFCDSMLRGKRVLIANEICPYSSPKECKYSRKDDDK